MQKAVRPAMPVETTRPPDSEGDLISVVMSNYRGMRWLDDAINAVLAQTHRHLELIIVDDASGDDSLAMIRAAAARDRRVRLIECSTNIGPAAARNLALDAAQGEWIAIMDSDDLIHPERFARMIGATRHLACDAVADDMIFFGDRPGDGGRTLLQPLALTAPRDLHLATFLASDNGGSGLPPFGYLKPLIRKHCLHGLRYDPTLRVGEDFDFYARLLCTGARLSLIPDAMYLYRRHGASLSHRLSVAVLQPLLAAHHALARRISEDDAGLLPALDDRRAAIEWALHYARLVAALKQREGLAALRVLMRHPRLVKPLWQSARERWQTIRILPDEGARPPLDVVLIPQDHSLSPAVADALPPGALHIAVPHLAAPGMAADTPIAPLAARLSDLSSRYRLDIRTIGAAGAFAAGMVPNPAGLHLLPEK
jgi:succinoglycan biosynthesis protein ExoO